MSKSLVEVDVINHASPVLKQLGDRVRKIGGNVSVGIKNDQHANSNLSVAEIGAIHEFGKGHVPQRPFVAPAIKQNQVKYLRFIATQIAPMLLGRTNSGEIMDDVGDMAVQDVQAYMQNSSNFKPLHQKTVKHKGNSKPLIATGQLLRSIVATRQGGRSDALSWRGM